MSWDYQFNEKTITLQTFRGVTNKFANVISHNHKLKHNHQHNNTNTNTGETTPTYQNNN